MKQRMRPTLLQANGALLFAVMGCACLQVIRIILPDEWSSLQAAPIWDALQAFLLIGLGSGLCRRVKSSAREKILRYGVPSAAQVVLMVIAIGAGALFADDMTLLTGACMQRLGFDVSRQIAQPAAVPQEMYALRIICSGVLPAAAAGCFFHGGLMAAWERRGTRYAVITTAVLSALMCSSCVLLPGRLALALAAGAVMAASGSVYMAVFLLTGISVAGIAARQAQAGFGMPSARYGRLWAEIGGREGAGFLALETLLLGLVFYFLIRAVCSAKPLKKALWKPRNILSKPLSAANIFILAASVVTCLCMLAMDLMEMAGVF